jgi:hypothetical protein
MTVKAPDRFKAANAFWIGISPQKHHRRRGLGARWKGGRDERCDGVKDVVKGKELNLDTRQAGVARDKKSQRVLLCSKARVLRVQRLASRRDELETELRSILSQGVNATLSLLLFVEFSPPIHVFHSVAQHVVDQTCELGRHSLDGDGRASPGPESSILRSQVCLASLQGTGGHF